MAARRGGAHHSALVPPSTTMTHPRSPKRTRLDTPLEDAPRLVPHAGLPGVGGTTRFAYGFAAAGGASPSLARAAAAPHAPAAMEPATPAAGAPADVPAAAGGSASAVAPSPAPLAPGWGPSGYTAPARAPV